MAKQFPLRVFHDDVLFQFEDEDAILHDGKAAARGFKEVTSWGFTIVDSKSSASNARWGIVRAIGPDVDANDISIGRRILIENLKWTAGFKHDRIEYWKTNVESIIGVDSTEDK